MIYISAEYWAVIVDLAAEYLLLIFLININVNKFNCGGVKYFAVIANKCQRK